MSYVLKKVGRTPNIPFKTFECDNESDMANINLKGVPMGSRCYVINTGATYALNSEGEWKKVPSGGGSGDNIYDGGDENGGDTENKDVIYDGGEEV